jgi:hypothetical protein
MKAKAEKSLLGKLVRMLPPFIQLKWGIVVSANAAEAQDEGCELAPLRG